MNQELYIALTGFAIATLFTPGPNNLMLMASGLNFGVMRTLPHLFGVSLGFSAMVAGVGLGVNRVFDAVPASYVVMQVLSIGYLLYLTYRIATQTEIKHNQASSAKPFTFLQAALFQWVNPKAWAMAVSATSLYAPQDRAVTDIIIIAATFAVWGTLSSASWTLIGQQLRRFLSERKKMRLFNFACAILILASMVPIFLANN